MEDINRILVVSRDTKYCKEAVHYGISLARKYGAELFVIHVVNNPFGLEGWNLPTFSLEKEYQAILSEVRTDLHRIITKEKATGLHIEEMIREGDATEEILKAVKENRIDLMVMLAHEEGRLEHFLFGRSNEELIRRLPCSLCLVKKEPKPVKW